MTVNLSKALLTFSATIFLVAASATSSNARPHAQRLSSNSKRVRLLQLQSELQFVAYSGQFLLLFD